MLLGVVFVLIGFVGFIVTLFIAGLPILFDAPTWVLLISEFIVFVFFASFAFDRYNQRYGGTIKKFIAEDKHSFVYFILGIVGGAIIATVIALLT